jgi:hypothetical protein
MLPAVIAAPGNDVGQFNGIRTPSSDSLNTATIGQGPFSPWALLIEVHIFVELLGVQLAYHAGRVLGSFLFASPFVFVSSSFA